MLDPFVGPIIAVGFNFAPVNWHLCDGTLLPIQQYAALFSLLGTYYGGNGTTTFALPDLRGRVAVGQGQGPGLSVYNIGQAAGAENVTLIQSQMPQHSHLINAVAEAGGVGVPTNALLAGAGRGGPNIYSTAAADTTLAPNAIANAGGGQPHTNIQPYLTLNYIIALNGIYPSRN